MTPQPENGRKRPSGATSAPTRPEGRITRIRSAWRSGDPARPIIEISYREAWVDAQAAIGRYQRILAAREAELRMVRRERDELRATVMLERTLGAVR
jgi:hypothetical protein